MPRPKMKRTQFQIILALMILDAILLAGGKLGLLALLITIGLPAYGLIRVFAKLLRRSHLIWRLRSRLMVTYIFVGAVPIVLILALAYTGTWMIVGQVAAYLVSSELTRTAQSLENPARFMGEAPPAQRSFLARQMAPILATHHPGFEVFVSGPEPFHYPENGILPQPPDGWPNFTGLVEKGGKYYCMSVVRRGDTQSAVLAPLTAQVMTTLAQGVGALSLVGQEPRNGRESDVKPHLSGSVPAAWNAVDFEYVWFNSLDVTPLDAPGKRRNVLLSVITRPSAVLSTVFAGRGSTTQEIFIVIAALLAVVELVSVAIGITMTRTITGAVHNLYTGTEKIAAGEFSHRIPVRGDDQLAELGKSFNQMTEHLGRLMIVEKEKERLQSELAIASEVQAQLFPRKPPAMANIRLVGACEPARSVSGDYYDYLCLPDGNLAIAIGDVAGKGISAALLMASIQSILRTQLASGTPSPALLVSRLNKQLYENTSPEKYATFFCGIYDEHSRLFTYTNAGHLPPLLVRGEQAQPLDVTGTVVGIFPKANYAEQTIEVMRSDLLIAYTDGITEPENAYGEEFGTDRLCEAVLRHSKCEPDEIVAKVIEAVKHWSHAPELPDDMTVLVAQGIA